MEVKRLVCTRCWADYDGLMETATGDDKRARVVATLYREDGVDYVVPHFTDCWQLGVYMRSAV